jgi:hypothetical protein
MMGVVVGRVLSERALGRALLARQLLLERATLPIPEALERVGGLQTQYPPTAYIGLWSRLAGFRRADLTDALAARAVVQATLMRATIHMVSAADYWPMARGTLAARRELWLRAQREAMAGVDIDALVARIRAILHERPRRTREIQALLVADGYPATSWATAAQLMDLVRVPPSGTWDRRRADLYGLADDWLSPPDVSEAEGYELLVRRYLGAFGPAAIADIASWAGLPATVLREVVERIDLARYHDTAGRQLVDLPGAPLPDPDTPAPARFIGTWEALLLVHARRTQVLPERFRSLVFSTANPPSVPTFLVDGRVAGAWRYVDGQVRLEPFEAIAPSARAELEAEAERLTGLHAADAAGGRH